MRAIISRFAPAPTGHLHLGHVVNAIYVWGVTKGHSTGPGRVLLRIEDHDRHRSRAAYEAGILEDLAWLGFASGQCEGFVRQSDRQATYARALDSLRRQGLVYACECSRADIEHFQDRAGSITSPAEFPYPGTCRHRGLADAPGRGLRVRLEPAIERFVDLRHGPQAQRPSEQCGDLLIRDRDGNWTYQFAVAVDDHDQEITLVIRGDDLLASTGRQIQLARLLGRATPARFLHHPLLMRSPAQKLSKSDGDTGIRELRAAGWTPENVIGLAAARIGLIREPRPIHASEVPGIMAS